MKIQLLIMQHGWQFDEHICKNNSNFKTIAVVPEIKRCDRRKDGYGTINVLL